MFPFQAERDGFEPSLPLRVNRFSRPAHSTTLPPLQSNTGCKNTIYSCNHKLLFLTFYKELITNDSKNWEQSTFIRLVCYQFQITFRNRSCFSLFVNKNQSRVVKINSFLILIINFVGKGYTHSFQFRNICCNFQLVVHICRSFKN